MSQRKNILIPLLLLVLVAEALASCMLGAVNVDLGSLLAVIAQKTGFSGSGAAEYEAVIWGIRLPRVVLSVGVGALLGLCGAAMQGLFRNPLADPSIIGISAGAALAAAVVIVLAGSWLSTFAIFAKTSALSVFTFIGAVGVALLLFPLSRNNGKSSISGMLLVGIAINAFTMALIGLLTFLADDVQLRTLSFWTLGSLGGATWGSASVVWIVVVLAFAGIISQYKSLNLLALGESEAQHAGVSTERVKRRIIFFTALGIGTSVAICGMISFVGLIVPHIIRLLLGSSDNRVIIPASAIGGACLLCFADTVSRTIAIPAEVPVGVITSLMGAPFFLFLLLRKQKNVFI